MGTFRDVTKQYPCPICGKTDWCSFLQPDTAAYPGQLLCVCRRIQASEITSSINGKTYYSVKELSDGSILYTDVKKDAEKDSHAKGYVYTPLKPSVKPEDISNPPLPNEELDKVYRDFMAQLSLSEKHLKKLLDDGWTKKLVKDSQIRSLSFVKKFDKDKGIYSDQYMRRRICNALTKKYGTLAGVPGFYQLDDGHWSFVGKSGMLIPVFDRNRKIYRLRLRLDKPEVNEKGKEMNKYKNFSSYKEENDENGNTYNIYNNGCRSGSNISIYYSPTLDDTYLFYVTEGEKKAIVANHLLKVIVICLPGTGTYSKLTDKDSSGMSCLDYLKSLGCTAAAVAYDADKLVNEAVQRHEKNLVKLLKENGFTSYVTRWNAGFGKGLDDILLLGIRPELIPA